MKIKQLTDLYDWYLDSDERDIRHWIWITYLCIRNKLFLRENLSLLPTAKPDYVSVGRCKFRWHFCALRFGGWGGHGIAYEWLGFKLEIGQIDERDHN